MVTVRPATPADAVAWEAMRQALWPDGGDGSHKDEVRRFFAGQLRLPDEVLIALDGSTPVGMVELSIRSYAEGSGADRVAFLEGWFVVPEARKRGVGRALIAAAEDWSRAQNCRELGSDALLDNHVSAAAHLALGFDEVGQLRCFLKRL